MVDIFLFLLCKRCATVYATYFATNWLAIPCQADVGDMLIIFMVLYK
jgi:hypothetical protein